MLESLKQKKHHNSLLRFIEVMQNSTLHPVLKKNDNVEISFKLSYDTVLFKFFFGIIPILSFATYFDDWTQITSTSKQNLRNSFINSYMLLIDPFISGTDIMLTVKPPLT